MRDDEAVLAANENGEVNVTQDMYSPAEAEQNLFIGNPAYKGKGDYVVAFQKPEGACFEEGEQGNEFMICGTLRIPRSNILYGGPNPFGLP